MSRTNKGNNPANPHQQNIKRSIMSRVRVLYAVLNVLVGTVPARRRAYFSLFVKRKTFDFARDRKTPVRLRVVFQQNAQKTQVKL